MRLESGYESHGARIEMVPLIDCVFLLLVFFMFAMLSMTVHRGLEVKLPKAGGEIERESGLTIMVSEGDALTIEGRAVTVEEAVAEAAARTTAAGGPVLIGGDRGASLGVAIGLLGRLREEGVEAVSFLVRPEDEP